jgi:hypothetical protein
MSSWDDIATPEDLEELARRGIHWDVRAMRLVSSIERSIVELDLDSQAPFVSLLNTMQVQLESGRPDATVVRLLGEALLALATARGVPVNKLDLAAKVAVLNKRVSRPPVFKPPPPTR